MTKDELTKILDLHKKRINGDIDVKRANLIEADLTRADLNRANLIEADLTGANLIEADLTGANLTGADLTGAYLNRADLTGAKNAEHALAQASIVPECGSFVGWKKCRNGVIVKLLIPENAKRSSATGRKCRAEFVEVLEVIGEEKAISIWDDSVVYEAGKTVHCHNWDENRFNECSGGIHFFITRIEAENY
jgi:hypothetical protein